MSLLLIFMSGVISAYWYLTDPVRIKSMSETYLARLVGGPVNVGSASLTVFEGLKLTDVTVKVDGKKAADDTLFFAKAIEIQYNPASLLRGQLEATRIIATDAKVTLVEEAKSQTWNYQRIHRTSGKPTTSKPTDQSIQQFPEVVLRNADVQYSEMEGKIATPRGDIAIDGRFFPSFDASLYQFELQSRGASQGVGPVIAGNVVLKSGQVVASLSNLQFGRDVEAMLPREVRDFWVSHQFQGALDIPDFRYTPPTKNHRAEFLLRTKLTQVRLIARPDEFEALPPAENFTLSRSVTGTVSSAIRSTRYLAARMRAFAQRPPLQLYDVSGEFIFDQDGMSFNRVTESVAGATLLASGKIGGYSPDSPIWLRIESKPGKPIEIPADPDFLASLPAQAHMLYTQLKPAGTGNVWAEITRTSPSIPPQVSGEVEIVDASIDSVFFPYPVRHARGKVAFHPDPEHTYEMIELRDMHGMGIAGGPNQNTQMHLTGLISAMDDDCSTQIRVQASPVVSEPALFAAFPAPVRQALEIFRGPGNEKNPHFAGSFDCNVFVPFGQNPRPIVSVDLNFTDGSGKLVAFPYPVEKLAGKITVRDGFLTMDDVKLHHGQATVDVSGKVSWPTDLPDGAQVLARPELKLVAKNIPVDNDLLKALPSDAQAWLRTLGASGSIDVDGNIKPNLAGLTPADSVGFDLNLALHNGAIHLPQSNFSVTDATGNLIVHADRMEVLELHGRRDNADLQGSGQVDWSTGKPALNFNAIATNLTLDQPLHDLLPEGAKDAWATLDPHGKIDVEVKYNGASPGRPGDPIASLELPGNSAAVAPQPLPGDFKVTLRPTDVSVTAKPLPYRLDHCTGSILVTPQAVTLSDIRGQHGKAGIALSGKGITTNPNDWDLSLSTTDMPVDAEFLKAVPPQIRQTLEGVKFKGPLNIDLKTLRYRGDHPDADIDLAGTISTTNASVDFGVPVDKIGGAIQFQSAVRAGKLTAFRGDLALNDLSIAGRPVDGFKASLDLPKGSDVLSVTGIRGEIAQGELAGTMDLKFPDTGDSSYSLNLAVKNADLREMAQQVASPGQQIRGQLSASVALQGEWADPSTRRGRGDVLIAGKEMYQIPLLLGLLEVTNLSLPTSSPFSEGTARYLVEGNRVTFEQIQMRSSSLVMSGNGWLDFGSKQVRMNFTTENPNLPFLPVIHELWEGAKQELLQIQVRGTVQSPKVSAGMLHTFTTTVDEVLNGSGKEK